MAVGGPGIAFEGVDLTLGHTDILRQVNLQVAAGSGQTLAFAYRPQAEAANPSPAALRLLLVLRYVEASPRGHGRPQWRDWLMVGSDEEESGAEEVVVLDRERLGVLDASVALGVFGGLLWWSQEYPPPSNEAAESSTAPQPSAPRRPVGWG